MQGTQQPRQCSAATPAAERQGPAVGLVGGGVGGARGGGRLTCAATKASPSVSGNALTSGFSPLHRHASRAMAQGVGEVWIGITQTVGAHWRIGGKGLGDDGRAASQLVAPCLCGTSITRPKRELRCRLATPHLSGLSASCRAWSIGSSCTLLRPSAALAMCRASPAPSSPQGLLS